MKRTITTAEQRAASDIVIRLYMLDSFCLFDNLMKEIDEIIRDYELKQDPFTGLPCSKKDYEKAITEYERQLFEEKYGYPPEIV